MPSAPIRQLLIVEALGHTRVPFAGYRPDHRAGVELAAERCSAPWARREMFVVIAEYFPGEEA